MSTSPSVMLPDAFILAAGTDVRARRAPSGILAHWAFEASLAAFASCTFSALVGSAYGSHPFGDAPLYEAGGLNLGDFLVWARPFFTTSLIMPLLSVTALVVLGPLPLAVLLGQMAFAEADGSPIAMRKLLGRASRAWTPMLVLQLGFYLAQALMLGVAVALGRGVSSLLQSSLGDARADQLGVVTTILVAMAPLGLGIAHDIARAAAIRFEVPAPRAAKMALNTLLGSGPSVAWSWAWRWGLGASLVLLCSSIVIQARGSALTVLLLLFVHQAVMLLRSALRASWFARAMRALDKAHDLVTTPPSTDGSLQALTADA